MEKNILVVGTGVTASTLTYLLARLNQKSSSSYLSTAANAACTKASKDGLKVNVSVWDKARGSGGRFSSYPRYVAETKSMSSNSVSVVDSGAQYITKGAGKESAVSDTIYTHLLDSKIIAPFKGEIIGHAKGDSNYVGRFGLAGVCEHLLHQSKTINNGHFVTINNPVYHKRISKIELIRENESNNNREGWKITDTNGECSIFDAVVCTIPIPQFIRDVQVCDTIKACLSKYDDEFEQVSYSTRFALLSYYDASQWDILDKYKWSAKYVDTPKKTRPDLPGGCLRYISIENRKRKGSKDLEPVVLLHSSVPYGMYYQNVTPAHQSIADVDSSSSNIGPKTVIEHFQRDLSMEMPDLEAPKTMRLQRWLYSQVRAPEKETLIDQCQGALLVGEEDKYSGGGDHVLDLPALILSGDGFVGSNFDNCLYAANASLEKLLKTL